MNRYELTTINKRFDGKRVYQSTFYPKIPTKPNDIYITTNETMFLDSLAHNYYNDKTLWWVIYRANGLSGGGLKVPIGIQLRIPMDIPGIIEDFKKINSQ